MEDVGPGGTSFVRRWLSAEGAAYRGWDPALVYWFGALIVSVVAAAGLVLVFRETPVPPGGDPGNWLATSLAYVGRPYPSQLFPLAYPPIVFPLLGASVVLAGSPLLGVDLFAGALMVGFGLSLAALATTLLRSRVVALALVALVLADPSILAMFFWGAYPNLLGFVFLNLAFVGLLRAGRGYTSTGAAQFWAFAALATLTHSLVGVALATVLVLFVLFAVVTPTGSGAALLERARIRSLDSPGVAARALFVSRGGRAGLLAFALLVGGYYGLTFLAGIPHPYYLSSNSVGFRLSSMSGAFQALLPNVLVQPSLVLAILVVACASAGILYAVVRDRRPAWLTTGAVLLIAWPLAISLLFVGGFVAQIVTDYHRFGFFYIVPAGLILAYLAERGWVRRRRPDGEAAREAPRADGPWRELRRRFTVDRSVRRPIVFGAIALVILVAVVDTATVPALGRDERSFTKVGHDPAFLAAIRAIEGSGVAGGILTVPGADKWTRGLTGENAYAPYSSDTYLFYPSQRLDSQLSYYALSSHFALTNGLVSASVRAVSTAESDGVPDYSVYVLGTPREVLRIPPGDIRVGVAGANGTVATVPLTTGPTVTLPASLAAPMEIRFAQKQFVLTISVSVLGASPESLVRVSAVGVGNDRVVSVDLAVVPPSGGSALAWPATAPGSFEWTLLGGLRHPETYGNVTPVTALGGATDYDPAVGGPAAIVDFAAAPNASGGAAVGGTIALNTPAAAGYLSGLPSVLSTPAIWQTLGIRFVLMRNESIGPTTSLDFVGEIPYLVDEYALPVLYANPEWTVLAVPAP